MLVGKTYIFLLLEFFCVTFYIDVNSKTQKIKIAQLLLASAFFKVD